MSKILWCPQHSISAEQLKELNGSEISTLKDVDSDLFDMLKDCEGEIDINKEIAYALIDVMVDYDKTVLPIGSPLFMAILMKELAKYDHKVDKPVLIFAHSNRISEDHVNEDGSVTKTSKFVHVKFVEI